MERDWRDITDQDAARLARAPQLRRRGEPRPRYALTTEGAGVMERVETREPTTASDKMHEASEAVSSKAGEAVDRGRGLVADQIGHRSTQLSDQIGSASQSMRRVAEQARAEGNSQQARLVDQ